MSLLRLIPNLSVRCRVVAAAVVALLVGFGATSTSTLAQRSEDAADWDTAMSLPPAPDLNPDPGIVEINLETTVAQVEVAPGRRIEAWTYNGAIPGPMIHVKVGDRLIVHFT